MPIKPRERRLVLLGVVVVGGVLLWDRLNPPKPPISLQKQVTVEEAEKRRQAAIAEMKRLRLEKEAQEPRIQQASYNRPADELIPRVVRDLQRIAKQAGIHFTEIKPQRSRPLSTSSLEKIPIEVRFRAAFQPNVMKFFYLLEAPKGKMTLEKFNVTSGDPRLKTVDVTALITVFTRLESHAEEGETPNANPKES
jgi:Tfp pilus assembly protein PilO